jgi:uncharacterized protein (TIGR00290 family)
MVGEPIALSWSGGKDSAMTLHELRGDPRYDVVTLLTTVTDGHDRISMHGVRVELLRAQAAAVGLRVQEVRIPQRCSNADYEHAMGQACTDLRGAGIGTVAFGDLHLADVRAYRERQLAAAGMSGLFPVWGRDTTAFMRDLLTAGFVARVVCLDPGKLSGDAAGRQVDRAFLDDLPDGVDPAGENGEFHTFVTDGPVLERPVKVALGDRVTRDGFCYVDLVPA